MVGVDGTKMVTTVHIATVFATALSVLALLVCFIVAPMIYSEVQSVWRELDMEINEFKVGPVLKIFECLIQW